jgi:hypothetical protein
VPATPSAKPEKPAKSEKSEKAQSEDTDKSAKPAEIDKSEKSEKSEELEKSGKCLCGGCERSLKVGNGKCTRAGDCPEAPQESQVKSKFHGVCEGCKSAKYKKVRSERAKKLRKERKEDKLVWDEMLKDQFEEWRIRRRRKKAMGGDGKTAEEEVRVKREVIALSKGQPRVKTEVTLGGDGKTAEEEVVVKTGDGMTADKEVGGDGKTAEGDSELSTLLPTEVGGDGKTAQVLLTLARHAATCDKLVRKQYFPSLLDLRPVEKLLPWGRSTILESLSDFKQRVAGLGLSSLKRYAATLRTRMIEEDTFRLPETLPAQRAMNGLHLKDREELSRVTREVQVEMDLVAEMREEVYRLEDALVTRKQQVREADAMDDIKTMESALEEAEVLLTDRRLRLRDRETQLTSFRDAWRVKLCQCWGDEIEQFSCVQQKLWISLGNITALTDYQSVLLDALEKTYERRSTRNS